MKPKVFHLSGPEEREITYDFALATVGYESRARHFFQKFQGRVKNGTVCMFEEQQMLDYKANEDFFKVRKFKPIAASTTAVRAWATEVFKIPENGTISVLVDISSMNRNLIAAVCFHLLHAAQTAKRAVAVDFVYSPAEFGDIPDTFGPVVFNGPCLDELAGWPPMPALPCGLVLGIGYEEDLALGVIEDLEAARVWAFRPKDHDPRYDDAINARNRGLFEEIAPANLIRYSIFDPFTLFTSLEALIGLSKSEYRMIIVPFGPKIFALASCLAALFHYPMIGFWRVSGGANIQPVDRRASGSILGLSARWA